ELRRLELLHARAARILRLPLVLSWPRHHHRIDKPQRISRPGIQALPQNSPSKRFANTQPQPLRDKFAQLLFRFLNRQFQIRQAKRHLPIVSDIPQFGRPAAVGLVASRTRSVGSRGSPFPSFPRSAWERIPRRSASFFSSAPRRPVQKDAERLASMFPRGTWEQDFYLQSVITGNSPCRPA